MIVLGIDPGETTGLAQLYIPAKGFIYNEVAGLSKLYASLLSIKPDIIICEGFDRRQKAGNIEPIIEHIAIAKLYTEQMNSKTKYYNNHPDNIVQTVKLEFQSASYGKAFWDNDKLKAVDCYSKLKHARDATRHVLQYMTFTYKDSRWIDRLKPTP